MQGKDYLEHPHLGLLPNDWKVVNAIEVCTKITDGTHDTPNPTKQGIPYIKSVHVKKGTIRFDDCLYLCQADHDVIYKRCNPEKGDLLIVNIGLGNIGDCAYVGVDFEFSMKNIALLKPDSKQLNDSYFYHYYKSRQQKVTHSTKTGGAQPFLSLRDLKKLKIVLPPLPDQRKIATILGTWDKSISTVERLIDNSKQQKKALMQQLLTSKKHLLDDSGMPFEGEWEELNIGSIGTIHSGGTPSTTNKEYWDGDINWITPTDITKQSSVYINSSLRKISSEGLKNSSSKLVPKGSLLVCTRATIGEMAITAHEMCTNQGFKNIIPNENTNILFVYHLLHFYKHKLVSKASGSTFLELSKSAFEGIRFDFPNLEEQQKISVVISNSDNEINLLEQQLSDLKQEKKALMQQLLTGKRRVRIEAQECIV
ncbi:MAG: type I restriction enzyme S subunit [Francisellaceae bacterium]|jgi:type I restriction enzyme S subunit